MAKTFFGRSYKLTLTLPGGQKEFIADEKHIGYDIKFSVSFSPSNGCRSGSLSILGLSLKSIEQYIALASMNRGDAAKKMLKVKLEAGYITTGNIPIFDGYAYYAAVRSPPEMWLDISVSEINPLCGNRFSYPCIEPTPLQSVAEGALGNFGVSFGKFLGTKKSILKNKVLFPGEPMDLYTCIDTLNKLAEWRLVLTANTVDAYDLDMTPKQAVGDFEANWENGLLGVSGVSSTGCTVTTFLQDNDPYHIGHLKLNSELYKNANGKYIITNKRHTGHFRGKEWYTVLTCQGKIA